MNTAAAVVQAAAPVSQFQGVGGAVIVSLIAFTIVFAVLAGLSAIICFVRYIAMIAERKNGTPVPSAGAPAAAAAVSSASVSRAAGSDANDMKKIVAVISAAINASTGRSMNIISVTPAQGQGNSSGMHQMWRVTGIAECMESRLGSRSW